MPTRIRRRLGDFWQSFTAPFRSIGAALVLMWRAGAVLIASYILLFAIVEFAEQWMLVGAGRAIGPHDVASFWLPMSVGLVAAAAVLTEPVRVAIIAVAISLACGVVLGMLAGFTGGALDTVVMRVVDVVFSFPVLLLALAIVAVLAPGGEAEGGAMAVLLPLAGLAALRALVPAEVAAVVLVRDAPRAQVEAIIDAVAPDVLQFHGGEDDAFCASFGLPFLKAVAMPGVTDALLLARVGRIIGWRRALANATDAQKRQWSDHPMQWVKEVVATVRSARRR